MARGQQPSEKSLQNLRTYTKDPNLTEEERKEIARRGGQKSGETRRKQRDFRAFLERAMSVQVTNKAGVKTTRKEASMMNLAQRCANGELKAIELAMNILGENPTQKLEVTGKDGHDLIPARRLSKEEAAEMLQNFEKDY